ncbi:Zn-dependent hydrolase [bacterium]|nr:MAG: Zn-dependent hydrolase [bacterium]
MPISVCDRLAELGEIGRGERGLTRQLFTEPEHRARALLARWGRELNCEVVQDRIGNLFVRRAGRSNAPALQFGSHLDTVLDGGAYDGAYGVAGGVSVLAELAAHGVETQRPFELAAWAGEEGSRFPVGCLGSAVYVGWEHLDEMLELRGDDGMTLAQARNGPYGLLPDVPIRDDFPRPAAYAELHIEQGPVLERAGVPLGVVTAIAGMHRYTVRVNGEAGHAGTVPMPVRRDAFSATAELALMLESAAREIGDCVATIGWLAITPNQTNIVPGLVECRIDARSTDPVRLKELDRRIHALAKEVAGRRSVRIDVHRFEERAPTPLDEGLKGILRETLDAHSLAYLDVPSGAVHDAMCIASICPAAMLFVPSIAGASHVGHERTAPADLERGVDAFKAWLLAIDRAL